MWRAALVWLLLGCPVAAIAQTPARARVAVFFEPGFPSIDAPAPDVRALQSALGAFDVSVLDAEALPAALDAGVDVLVLPFGSAFPQDAWPAILRFLPHGGSWVNLGGAPLALPVTRDARGWHQGTRTPSYHRQLGIVQAVRVDTRGLNFVPAFFDGDTEGDDAATAGRFLNGAKPEHVYELVVRLTSSKSFPGEDGSDGPREARLTALVHGFRADAAAPHESLPVVAPLVAIDRLLGTCAGGRWVLVTGDAPVSAASAASLVAHAARAATELRVQPRYAGFHPGEAIVVTVSLLRPGGSQVPASTSAVPLVVRLRDSKDGRVLCTTSAPLANGGAGSVELTLPVETKTLARGPYTVTAQWNGVERGSGFWIYDAAMVAGGKRLTPGRDYFVRDGQPFPMAGTTYMATDVHRRFLLEPNPRAWDADFANMSAAGVNVVRTGIWTAWQLHSEADGRPTEGMLRALEVFLLTARRHDIPVIFNLFAFVPHTWGGTNPYFDPRALEAQQRFAGSIAARLAGANDIAWDLINEPSFSSPDRLWSTRPNYDAAEQAAWERWLRESVNTAAGVAANHGAVESEIQARWNSVAGDTLALPTLADFGDKHLFANTRPNKAADYKRFAQASFMDWVKALSSAIRANGNAAQLITVGQDEGGASERPNPLVFGEAVDFTGTHTWWNNDALLWDALVSKRPDRPSLIGETGLMTYERIDGSAWRSEADNRNLLERKLALAVAAGGAGFIQWLWNTNVYMPIDNEAGIGLLRADGTAKPEVSTFARLAAFVNRHRTAFADRQLEDIAVVVPQSQIYSVRDLATAATQRAVRTFEYGLRAPVRTVAEDDVAEFARGARLVVVPSPRVLTAGAWTALLAAADAGAIVLVTGPVDRDEYERPVEGLAALGIHAQTRPVAPTSVLDVDGTRVSVPFRGAKLERLERGVVEASGSGATGEGGGSPRIVSVARGKGRVVWCPLPVELSDDERATAAVYRYALSIAGIQPVLPPGSVPDGVLVRPLMLRAHVLWALVNETDADVTVRLPGVRHALSAAVTVPGERALLVLVDRPSGKILDSSR